MRIIKYMIYETDIGFNSYNHNGIKSTGPIKYHLVLIYFGQLPPLVAVGCMLKVGWVAVGWKFSGRRWWDEMVMVCGQLRFWPNKVKSIFNILQYINLLNVEIILFSLFKLFVLRFFDLFFTEILSIEIPK